MSSFIVHISTVKCHFQFTRIQGNYRRPSKLLRNFSLDAQCAWLCRSRMKMPDDLCWQTNINIMLLHFKHLNIYVPCAYIASDHQCAHIYKQCQGYVMKLCIHLAVRDIVYISLHSGALLDPI